MKFNIEEDLRELEAMASNLTPYLYEKELYGVLSQNMARLTVGGVLLRLQRLSGLSGQLSPDQQARLNDARLNFEQARSEWMHHYRNKVEQEMKARLNDLNNYLSEFRDDLRGARNAYPVEAQRRTIVEHLQDEMEALALWDSAQEEHLRGLDKRLRAMLDEDESAFIWSDALTGQYPADRFWWLYRQPVEKKKTS